MKFFLVSLVFFLVSIHANPAFARQDNSVNVYTWSGVIPDKIIRQFEQETGIKVNFSTYENNEILFTKLKSSNAEYDVIEPSSYFVDRMRRQNMLTMLDHSQLSNFSNINPQFLNIAYDPKNQFSTPFIWGVTGIFYNQKISQEQTINKWSDLWKPEFRNQLMLLDDSREVFAIGLRVLGYSINDTNLEHIKQAYLKLKELLPNIKLFNSDAVISNMIDEDANLGMAWNGDLYKAKLENPELHFLYPQDGFAIWVDNFAIPARAPHLANAYRFINFMLRADVAEQVALYNHYPTPNLAAQNRLPPQIKNNPIIYPSKDVLRRGEFQTDLGDEALAAYEHYWELLKLST